MSKDLAEILATRKNPILQARENQLAYNKLCYQGSKPYIENRLVKFPCEISSEFNSRKSHAYLTNYARRITEKINQALFNQKPSREGIDEDFYLDVSMSGDQKTLQDILVEASSLLTIHNWCWLRVDRPQGLTDEDGNPIDQSLTQKQARGDRPYLSLYDATQVVDWSFDDKGQLEWVITEEEQQIAKVTPFTEYGKTKTRTIWYGGRAEVYQIQANATTGRPEAILAFETFYSSPTPPFILLGTPSPNPIAFDDIEAIQASMLNLESSHTHSIWRSHFSMLVLSEGVIRGLTESGNISDSQAMALVIGEGRAITEESEEKGITRYITPPAADLKLRREEVTEMKNNMFESIGMYMRRSGKAVESAESKAFDFNEIQSFLSERANILEQFEKRIVQLAKQIDPLFPEYTPKYNKDFSVRDASKALQSIILSMALPMPEEVKNYQQEVALSLIEETSGIEIGDERKTELIQAIREQEDVEIDQLLQITKRDVLPEAE